MYAPELCDILRILHGGQVYVFGESQTGMIVAGCDLGLWRIVPVQEDSVHVFRRHGVVLNEIELTDIGRKYYEQYLAPEHLN